MKMPKINIKNRFLLLLLPTIFILLLYLFYLSKTSTNTNNESEYNLEDPNLFQFGNHLSDSIPQKLLKLSFRYTLNNKNSCDNRSQEILAVFIITSYFGNVDARKSIRQVFSSEDLKEYKLRKVFLLGEAPEDKYTTQYAVNDENKQFKDIIQGNFLEAYRNLTYKHIMGLKWASTFCLNAKYIIKMDDDTVVNMYKLKFILNSLERLKKKDFIAGYVLRNLKAIREPVNKWYVTKEEYALSRYPSFVSGWFYVTNPQSARKIVSLSQYEKYFWIDDVFVTGILAKKLKIMQYDISEYFTVNSEFLQCCLQDLEKNISCDITVGPNGGNTNMFFEFNKKVKMCSINKCTKRTKPLNETCVAEKKINLGRGDAIVNDFKLV